LAFEEETERLGCTLKKKWGRGNR